MSALTCICGHLDADHDKRGVCHVCPCESLFYVVGDAGITECPGDACGAPLAAADIAEDGECRYCGGIYPTLKEWLDGHKGD